MGGQIKRLLFIGIVTMCAPSLFGQRMQPRTNVIEMVLHPNAATQGADVLALLPSTAEQQPGNAAPLYMMAGRMGPQDVFDQLNDQYRDMPFSELAKVDLDKQMEPYMRKLELVASAARRDHIEWGTDMREKGEELSLIYLNDLRSFTTISSLRARWQIARHEWEGARHTLQTGFSMCDQMNDHMLVIQGLVQCGMLDVFLNRLDEWAGEPGAPNLYWALSNLPEPLADLRAMGHWEQGMLYFTFPQLAAKLPEALSAEEWREIISKLDRLAPLSGDKSPTPLQRVLLMSARVEEARRALVSSGINERAVKAMPVNQLVGIYWFDQYKKASSEAWRAWPLPYWQSSALLVTTWAGQFEMEPQRQRGSDNPFFEMFCPSLRVRWQFARIEQRLGALRVIEAIRDFASRHQNQLPQSLDDIKDLPLPVDAITGKAFIYHVDGTKASLELPDIDTQQLASVYHLKIAQ